VLSSLLTESFDNGLVSLEKDNALLVILLPFNAFSYSIGINGLANSGTDQLVLSPEWRVPGNFDRNIISWFESPSPLNTRDIGIRMLSVFPPEVINADYIDLIRQARAANSSPACESDLVVEGLTDKIYELESSISLLNVIANLDIPLQLCYSEEDTVVSPRAFLDARVFGNANVTKYPGPLGFFPVAGDHSTAIVQCAVASVEEFLDNTSEDRANLITPLMGEQAAVCASKTAPPLSPKSADSEAMTPVPRMASILIAFAVAFSVAML
jgi:hypothetical protein